MELNWKLFGHFFGRWWINKSTGNTFNAPKFLYLQTIERKKERKEGKNIQCIFFDVLWHIHAQFQLNADDVLFLIVIKCVCVYTRALAESAPWHLQCALYYVCMACLLYRILLLLHIQMQLSCVHVRCTYRWSSSYVEYASANDMILSSVLLLLLFYISLNVRHFHVVQWVYWTFFPFLFLFLFFPSHMRELEHRALAIRMLLFFCAVYMRSFNVHTVANNFCSERPLPKKIKPNNND